MDEIRILCIDDEEEILCAMKAVLASQGWAGDYARDIGEALEIINLRVPDIIITDYHMPKIDGITGTGMLRSRLPDTPIIVFTIADDQEIADKFLAAGATDFAIKPLRAPDIIARIRLHIRMLSKKEDSTGIQNAQYYVDKGISETTLSIIVDYLKGTDEATVEEIAEGTGLAYQTVYRYIQHLQDKGLITAAQSYGKIGRPKRRFRLAQDET